jgi:hypothetical protein
MNPWTTLWQMLLVYLGSRYLFKPNALLEKIRAAGETDRACSMFVVPVLGKEPG